MTTATLPRTKRGPKAVTGGPLRVVIYCRISRDRIGAGLGVDRQETECRAWLAVHYPDAVVVAVRSDNDVSGYSGKPRPGYDDVVDMIRRGSVDMLVGWHMDRLTRRVIELASLIELCQRHGVTISTKLAGAFDPNNPGAVMTAQIQGTVAEYESAVKSERVRSKHRQLAAEGSWSGGRRPFGYRPDPDAPGGLVVDETEAAIVKEVAGRVLNSESMVSIARDLGARGVTGTSGGAFTGGSLRSMIIRGHLAGLRVHQGEVVAAAQWPAILDLPTHQAVVGRLADPSRQMLSRSSKWLLSGIGRCGVCDSTVRIMSTKRRALTGEYGRAYGCHGRTCVVRNAYAVDAAVTAWVVKRLAVSDAYGELASVDTDARELDALVAKLGEIDDLEVGLSDQWAAGQIDDRRYNRDLAALDKRRAKLDAEIGRLRDVVEAPERALDGLTGPNPRELFTELPLARRRAVVDLLCAVYVDPAPNGPTFRPETIRVVPKQAVPEAA
jgi:site-specific DNA recombinase